MNRLISLGLGIGVIALLAACASQEPMMTRNDAPNMSHVHMGHVLTQWNDTPGQVGLLTALEQEAQVAAQHAGFAANQLDNLQWMQMHTRHVRHAIDASSEAGGPGKGYGVLKAAQGSAAHVGFAADAPGASPNVKLHATHVRTSAQNVTGWAQEVMAASEQVLSATTASQAAPHVQRIRELTTQIAEGAGGKSWKEGEGGVAQMRQHMGLMQKGEGMM